MSERTAYHPKKRRKQLLIIITALVWIAAIATSAGKVRLAARAPINVTLGTKPTTVRVHINNEKQFDGAYIETPRTMLLNPGRNHVRISRDGYISAVFTVDALAGEIINMTDVVLQKNAELSFHPLEIITHDNDEPVYVSINQGWVTGETPLMTSDTVSGGQYMLIAYPDWPEQTGAQRCRVRIPAAKADDTSSILRSDAHRITIRRSNRNAQTLLFRGCDKLKLKP